MRRRLIILISSVLAIGVTLFATDYFILASEAQVEMQLRRFFRDEMNMNIEFEDVTRRFFSTRVTVRDVRFYSASGKSEMFLHADRMEISLSLLSAIRGEPIRKIKFVSPRITLLRDKLGRWNFPARKGGEDPFQSLLRGPQDAPTPEIELDNAQIRIEDEEHPESSIYFCGLNFTLKRDVSAPGRSITMAYFYKSESNENNRHLQLTFSLPGRGKGLHVFTSGSGSNYILLNDQIKGLLGRLANAGVGFAQSALYILDDMELKGAIRVESLDIRQIPDAPHGRNWSVKGGLYLENCSLNYPHKNQDGSITPIMFQSIIGRISLDDGSLHVNLNASALKSNNIKIKGKLIRPADIDSVIGIAINVPSPRLTDICRLLLPRHVEAVSRIKIQSGARLVLRLSKTAESREIDIKPGIHFTAGSAIYEDYPYALDDINGTIRMRDGRIEFDKLTARHKQGALKISGDIELAEDSPRCNISFQGKDIPLDKSLRDVLPEQAQKIWDLYVAKPPFKKWSSGFADIKGEVKTNNDGKIVPNITVDFRDAKIWMEKFPYQINNIKGRLVIYGVDATKATLQDFTGTHKGASGEALFSLKEGIADYGNVKIDITAKNVSMDAKFGEALQGTFKEAYRTLNPSGSVDILIKIRQTGTSAKEPTVTATVTSKETLSFTHEKLPLPVEAIITEFTVTEDRLIINNFSGSVGGAAIPAHPDNRGECSFGRRSKIDFTINKIIGFDIKKNADALPENARKALGKFDINGSVDIDELKINLDIIDEKVKYDLSLQVKCNDIAIGKKIKDVAGLLAIINIRGGSDGIPSITGKLKGFSLSAFNLKATDIDGSIDPIESEDGSITHHILSLNGKCYGGKDINNIHLSLILPPGEQKTYKGSIKLLGTNLKAILDNLGVKKHKISGKVAAYLDFELPEGKIPSATGAGWIRITEADLGKLPFLLVLKSVLNGNIPATQILNRGKVDFDLKGSEITLKRIVLKSDAITLVGKGTADIGGKLDIELFTDTAIKIPGVSAVFNLLNKKFYAARIVGTFMKPEVRGASIIERVTTLPGDIVEMLKNLPSLDVNGDD